ncbi:MAG: tetratricopeptide repeat protein, partial [Acidobacteriota bacterium]
MTSEGRPRVLRCRFAALVTAALLALGCGDRAPSNDPAAARVAEASGAEASGAEASGAEKPLETLPEPVQLEAWDPAAARQVLERRAAVERLEKDPRADASGRAWAWGRLGTVYHAYLRFDLARLCYRNALRLEPEDPRWQYLLAHILRTEGDFEGSSALLKRVLGREPEDASARYWLALNAIDIRDLPAARSGFASLLEARPQHFGARLGLARVELAEGSPREALELLEPAGAPPPEPPPTEWLELRMTAYRQLGDFEAVSSLAPLMPTTQDGRIPFRIADPRMQEVNDLKDSAQVYSRRAGNALSQGNMAAARRWLAKALERDPDRPELRYNLAAVAASLGETEAAERWLEENLERFPAHGLSRVLRARLLLGRVAPQAAPARRAWRRDIEGQLAAALEADPELAVAHVALGDFRRLRGDGEPALSSYREAERLDPGLERARLGLASVLWDLGRRRESLLELERAVEALPASLLLRHARWRAGVLLSSSGAEKARAELEADASSRTVSGLESRAMILASLGRRQEAEKAQQQAVDLLAARARGYEVAKELAAERLATYAAGGRPETPWAAREAWVDRRGSGEP